MSRMRGALIRSAPKALHPPDRTSRVASHPTPTVSVALGVRLIAWHWITTSRLWASGSSVTTAVVVPLTKPERDSPHLIKIKVAPVASPTMPTAACNGVALHFERVGHGRRLLYCNGSGTTLDSTRCSTNCQHSSIFWPSTIAACAPVTKPYTTADIAADMAALLDTIGWDRTALAG
jgi:hypothetical protein